MQLLHERTKKQETEPTLERRHLGDRRWPVLFSSTEGFSWNDNEQKKGVCLKARRALVCIVALAEKLVDETFIIYRPVS